MTKKTILIKNGIIATLGDKNKVLTGYALLIEDGLIKKLAPQKSFRGKYSKVIDATGKLVMPGFINAHMHFYSTFARGLGKAAPSKSFMEILNNLWWRLDKKLTNADSYYSAVIPLINAIRKGTTTIIDHHASPFAITGSLQAVEKAARETGIRSCLCYEVSDRDGKEKAKEGLDENSAFIAACAAKGDNMVKGMFGLHASFTISDETLEEAAYRGHKVGLASTCIRRNLRRTSCSASRITSCGWWSGCATLVFWGATRSRRTACTWTRRRSRS